MPICENAGYTFSIHKAMLEVYPAFSRTGLEASSPCIAKAAQLARVRLHNTAGHSLGSGCARAAALMLDVLALSRPSTQEDGRFGSTPSLVLQSAGSRVQWGASFAWEMPCSVPFFRTGDLGRLGPNGLEILGRMDNEVKIGGVCSPYSAHFRAHPGLWVLCHCAVLFAVGQMECVEGPCSAAYSVRVCSAPHWEIVLYDAS